MITRERKTHIFRFVHHKLLSRDEKVRIYLCYSRNLKKKLNWNHYLLKFHCNACITLNVYTSIDFFIVHSLVVFKDDAAKQDTIVKRKI